MGISDRVIAHTAKKRANRVMDGFGYQTGIAPIDEYEVDGMLERELTV